MMPSEAVAPVATTPEPSWSLARRVAFRFAFTYWVLFAFPFPFATIPGLFGLVRPVEAFRAVLVPWFGHHVLGLTCDIVQEFNGSGDRTYNWVNFAFQLALGFVVAVLWSLADHRRR